MNSNISDFNKEKNKNPNTFLEKSNISLEMANFLGEDIEKKYSLSEISSKIIKYIRENNLIDIQNPKKINPDKKLMELFNLNENSNLTDFTLFIYIRKHLIKTI